MAMVNVGVLENHNPLPTLTKWRWCARMDIYIKCIMQRNSSCENNTYDKRTLIGVAASLLESCICERS